jgi:hypothetical protein
VVTIDPDGPARDSAGARTPEQEDMAFDIAALERELDGAPPAADLSWAVGVAVVSDTFRLAGLVPPAPRVWDAWRRGRPRAGELVAELARALAATSLRGETVSALEASRKAAKGVLEAFFDGTSPLTGEMVRTNPFRREEFLRHWIRGCGGHVAGETERQSQERLAQLDYREALAEYKKADAARKAEAARRAQLLREAKEREEQAKGWRE